MKSGLTRNALGIGDAILVGLSSSGPAQTIAVSLASLVGASAYAGLLPILITLIPMLGIALAYQRLNRWNPNAGATYSWVARTLNPTLGFLSGWMILLYYTVGTASLTIPCGTYTLQFLAPTWANQPLAVGLVGAAWNLLVTLLALLTVQVAARFEGLIALFEYGVLGLFALIGCAAVFTHKTAVPLSIHWFTLEGAGGIKGLVAGILIACFMYSGWDAAIYVNEETRDPAHNPGRAAIASVLILAGIYSLCLFGFQGVLVHDQLQAHAGNVLAVIAAKLVPRSGAAIMSLIVLTGTLATLQASVIASARMGFAMSNDRVMPSWFRRIRPSNGAPYAATLAMSAVNLIILTLSLLAGSIAAALSNVISALGLISLVFYGLTAMAALWAFRNTLTQSARHFFFGGLLPAIGALFAITVIGLSIITRAISPTVLFYGVGAVGVGLIVAPIVGAHRKLKWAAAVR